MHSSQSSYEAIRRPAVDTTVSGKLYVLKRTGTTFNFELFYKQNASRQDFGLLVVTEDVYRTLIQFKL